MCNVILSCTHVTIAAVEKQLSIKGEYVFLP